MSENKMTKEEFMADRIAAGRLIDVETCEIWRELCNWADPYGVNPDCGHRTGIVTFVRSTESDGWVRACDLPPDKARALWDRMKRERANRVVKGIPL